MTPVDVCRAILDLGYDLPLLSDSELVERHMALERMAREALGIVEPSEAVAVPETAVNEPQP